MSVGLKELVKDNVVTHAIQQTENTSTQAGNLLIQGINKYSQGVEAIDKSVSIGNALGILTGLPQEQLPQNRLTNTSYHDIRSGAVNRIRQLNPTAGLVADIVAPNVADLAFGAGKIGKAGRGIKQLVKRGPDALRILRNAASDAIDPRSLAVAGGPGVPMRIGSQAAQELATSPGSLFIKGGGGVSDVAKSGKARRLVSTAVNEQVPLDPDLARRHVAKRFGGDPKNQQFMNDLAQMHKDVRRWVDGKGNGRLAGYPGQRTIIAPDGKKYRVRDSNLQGQTRRFSINQDISAQNTAQIRKIAREPDQQSLKAIFEKNVPPDKVESTLAFYNATNKRIYSRLTTARKRYNKLNPDNKTSIEHIFDVDFYKRLKKEVPGFKGQGADESWNLKMIPYVLNSKTGALNKKSKDIGGVLIDAIRKDEFIDYNKVVKDFVDLDLGPKINKLTPDDWDEIVDISMKNPKLNMQQILINYTQKKVKKVEPTHFSDWIRKHIKRSQEIGIKEPVWKDGSIDYIWRPQSNTGQIDIPPQSAKSFKGLRNEFFSQIEDLPSGSVWELNPKFKDEKRRRIYARLFKGDNRITRNADETLGWVLRVP